MRSQSLSLVLALWLLIGTAGAQENARVIFVTQPPDAAVFRLVPTSTDLEDEQMVGRSGQEIVFNRTMFPEQEDSAEIKFRIRHPHCIDLDIKETVRELTSEPQKGGVSVPREIGPLVLTYKQPLLALLHLPPVMYAAGLLIVPIGLLALRARSRLTVERKRLEQITNLIVSSAEEDPFLGSHLENWLLVEKLGRGGMATVYRALPSDRLSSPEEAVAIKILDADLTQDPDFLRRFQRETSLLMTVAHPGIVRILGRGSERGHSFLILELLPGGTLREKVRADGMTPKEACRTLEPVLEALAFVHQKDIVHRDLKPENLMVGADGKLKLTDFGLAKSQGASTLTATGSILGTPAYMAPEQIQGQLDARSDQYAMGIVLYELLAGRPPFVDEQPVAVVMKHLSAEPQPLGELASVSPAVSQVVHRMLAKEPEARFATMQEALTALRAAL